MRHHHKEQEHRDRDIIFRGKVKAFKLNGRNHHHIRHGVYIVDWAIGAKKRVKSG